MEREETVRSFQYNMTNAFVKGWYEKNHEKYTEEIEDVFYEGAEAAQKYLIEKACEWLEQHVNDDKYYSCIGEETLIPYLIEDFKKAMEE